MAPVDAPFEEGWPSTAASGSNEKQHVSGSDVFRTHARLDAQELAPLAARCFRGTDGERLLGYLKDITLNRALAPEVSDSFLRYVEGQRQLVAHLINLVERGRHG